MLKFINIRECNTEILGEGRGLCEILCYYSGWLSSCHADETKLLYNLPYLKIWVSGNTYEDFDVNFLLREGVKGFRLIIESNHPRIL